MYIAMNRFRIASGKEALFEEMWRGRESHLDDVPGFGTFLLLRGDSDDTATVFVSHTTWDSREDFVNWTESESFRKAHARARAPQGVYLGPPRFEGYEVAF